MKRPFWLDANTLIEAKRRWYRFHLVPTFWRLIERRIEAGEIRSCKQVYDEWCKGGDDLAGWVKRWKPSLSIGVDEEIQVALRRLADHVADSYAPRQAEEFLNGADSWLIAFAMALGGTVVTAELNKRKGKIRVPIICKEFNVPFTDVPGMIDDFNEPLA